MVEDGAAPDRGEDADRNAEEDGEQDRHRRQFDRRREQGEEFFEHRLLGDDRAAEIAVQQVAEVDAVLLQQRPVEAEFGAQRGMARRIDAALADQQSIGSPGTRRMSTNATR